MRLLSTKDVAELYDFSVSQIRRLICAGIIKAKKVGSYYVIEEKDVTKLKRRRPKPKKR